MKWILLLPFLCACGGELGIHSQEPSLLWGSEHWDNGRRKAEYQYFYSAKGRPVKHGSYREYSHLVDGLLTAEGTYAHGQRAGDWYERCGPARLDDTFENGGFETGDFTGWRLEGARSNSIELVSAEGVHQGLYAARLTLFPGDIVRSGNRVELVRADSGRYGQERIYSWSFKIDSDYVEEPYWQAICQFHSQPDFFRGENWDDYPEHKPPISILYSNNRCRLVYYSFNQVPRDIGEFAVEKGNWFEIFFQVKWSLRGDGYIEVYADGEPVTPFNGRDYKYYTSTVYNEVGNYLKIGLYRDARAKSVNSVYVDELAIEGCR